MATSTATEPAAAVPPVTCCVWCGGSGLENDEECAAVPCLECGGAGVPAVKFDLATTHTFPLKGERWARWLPAGRRLYARQGRQPQKAKWYTLSEVPGVAGEYGRAFELTKDDGEVHTLQCGPSGVSCTCGGETFRNTAKANRRAWERGDEVHPSLGCVHLDAVVPLLRGGWLDTGPA